MSRLWWGAWFGAALLGCASRPICKGAACSQLCPAGATIDSTSELARTCTVGADIEVTVETQGGKGSVTTRCERSGGTTFICRPVPGDQICGQRGIDSITRERVQCH